jgi:hypothetical protein
MIWGTLFFARHRCSLEIVRFKARVLCYSRKHPRPNLFRVVKRKYEIRITLAL